MNLLKFLMNLLRFFSKIHLTEEFAIKLLTFFKGQMPFHLPHALCNEYYTPCALSQISESSRRELLHYLIVFRTVTTI